MFKRTLILLLLGALPLAAQTSADPANAADAPAAKTPEKIPYTYVKLYPSNTDPEQFAEPHKAAELFTEREKLVVKLHDTRRKIIKEDNRAREIHAEMKKLAAELTLLLESKDEMKQLNGELKKIDTQLDAMPRKNGGTAAK